MIKNIILDMGNVLLTYNPDVILNKVFDLEEDKKLIKKELFEGTEWTKKDLGIITDEGMYAEISKRIPKRLHTGLKRCINEWDICMRPFPNAIEFCNYIKQKGYKIYILSNASTKFYDYFPKYYRLDFFDGMVISCDVHIVKPDLEIYNLLLKKYKLMPEESLFIDDLKKNTDGAALAGIKVFTFKGNFEDVKKLFA